MLPQPSHLKIHLWSIYYDPVPLGIGPVATRLAGQLAERGHDVSVVTSHPHYPAPAWSRSFRPHRSVRAGIGVLELPVFPHREKPRQRMLSELSYGLAQAGVACKPSRPDVLIAVVPSLMVVPGAVMASRLWGTPLVLWLQDIVSTAAAATGLVSRRPLANAIAGLERLAYRRAERIVTITDSFRNQLLMDGVAESKVECIYGGFSAAVPGPRELPRASGSVLVIGNIGLTQNLAELADAFQRSPQLRELGARLRITGDGVAAPALHAAIAGPEVEMLGVVSERELDDELRNARIAIVSQDPDVKGFNLPSKIMTYMAHGVPILAVVNPESEAAEIVRTSGAGWVADSSDLEGACAELAKRLTGEEELRRASAAGLAFARENFDPEETTAQFEAVLEAVRR